MNSIYDLVFYNRIPRRKIGGRIAKITFFKYYKFINSVQKIAAYGEVVATLERLQLQLRNISGTLGISGPGVEAELEAVRTLLVQKRFQTALATHHELKQRLRSGKSLKLHTDDASSLARDVSSRLSFIKK